MNEMPNELKDLLTIIGALVVIAFFLAVLVIAVMKIRDLIMEYRDTKRYEYKIAHRFDNPPLAINVIVLIVNIVMANLPNQDLVYIAAYLAAD